MKDAVEIYYMKGYGKMKQVDHPITLIVKVHEAEHKSKLSQTIRVLSTWTMLYLTEVRSFDKGSTDNGFKCQWISSGVLEIMVSLNSCDTEHPADGSGSNSVIVGIFLLKVNL